MVFRVKLDALRITQQSLLPLTCMECFTTLLFGSSQSLLCLLPLCLLPLCFLGAHQLSLTFRRILLFCLTSTSLLLFFLLGSLCCLSSIGCLLCLLFCLLILAANRRLGKLL